MHKLQFGIKLHALKVSWGSRGRGEGCDEKAASCLSKYISNAQTCFPSPGLLLVFLVSMLGFGASAQAAGTGWVLGSEELPPRNHTGVWEAPRCPALPLAGRGGPQPPPSGELPPWLWAQHASQVRQRPLQPPQEKHDKENLRVNIIIPVKMCLEI